MTELAPGAQTILDERTDLRIDEGDHERFSHYVAKNKLTEAMVMGTPVVALCGKVWVPSRNPDKFPVCPECKEIWQSMRPGGDGDESGTEAHPGADAPREVVMDDRPARLSPPAQRARREGRHGSRRHSVALPDRCGARLGRDPHA